MKHPRDNNVAKFLYESISTRFSVPRELVFDQGAQFTSNLITTLMEEYKIRHEKYSPYHPQANDQVEVTNMELKEILTQTLLVHKKDWATKLPEALWAYRTTWKTTTRFTPFHLVYGKLAMMHVEFEHKTLRKKLELDLDLIISQRERILTLNGLDEWRKPALHYT